MLKRLFEPVSCIKRLLGSWLCLCVLFECCETWFRIPSLLFILLIALCFFLIGFLKVYASIPILDDMALCSGAALYGLVLVYRYGGTAPYAFLLFILLAVVLITLPILRNPTVSSVGGHSVSAKSCRLLVLFFGMVLAVGISLFSVMRYLTFAAPNFDFGLFCNMFYNMKEYFLPLVTSERDQLLSHFAVHISPVYYVLLPFYFLFPSPITLQISQAIILASSILPLYLLAQHFHLSYKYTVLLALFYAAHPAVSAGCSYDLHENCFLLPLLLWLFYFYETGRKRWLFVAAVLILLVKEDAAAFLVVFAVYLLFCRKDHRTASPLIIGALLYFTVAVFLLNTYGTGAMFGRYSDLFDGSKNVGGFWQTLLRSPGYFLEIIVSFVDSATEKPIYLLQMLLPFGFVLWRTKQYSRYLLLTPFLLNLLSGFKYQYDIGFQYSFASLAFCIYLYLQNISERPPSEQRNRLLFSVVSACFLYSMIVMPKIETYVGRWLKDADMYVEMESVLDDIPKDASVTASTMLVAHLAQRDVIYEDFYHKDPDTEYVVLDMREGYTKFSQSYRDTCLQKGYEVWTSTEELLILYRPAE